MKRVAIAAAAIGVAFASAAQSQVKDRAVAVAQQEAIVTVTKVDTKAGTVTFRGPQGNLATMKVPPEAQNLDKVKPGAQFKMKYVEAAAVEIVKGGKPHAAAGEEVKVAPKGGNPGGVAVRTAQISGVIEAIDHANRQLAIKGPQGNVRSLKVADDVAIDQLSAGDRVAITYTQALALEMIPKPAAKKEPAAKKAEKKAS